MNGKVTIDNVFAILKTPADQIKEIKVIAAVKIVSLNVENERLKTIFPITKFYNIYYFMGSSEIMLNQLLSY